MANSFSILVFSFLVMLFINSCATNDTTANTDSRKMLLPEGNLSKITGYDTETNKAIIDSNYNTNRDDIAPALSINRINRDGYLDFCSEDMDALRHIGDIRPSKYLTQSDFRRNTDSLLFFSYLTDYIESITFTSANEGFISLSHPPSEDFALKSGLKIKGIGGGTDIFYFKLSPDATGFGTLTGIDAINSEFWDSHPYASTRITGKDTVTVVIWSSDNRNGKAFIRANYQDGQSIRINDTDIYYIFLVNGQAVGQPKPLKGEISLNDSNEGSPFAHCLCNNTNWLFFSSNRNNAPNNYDIYASRISVDFAELVIDVIEPPLRLDDTIIPILDKNDSIIKSIPASINSKFDDRFPFVLNSLASNPYLFLSSNRISGKVAISDSTYYKSIGGYDLYSFQLDSLFRCRDEPIKQGKYILEVHVLETNPGNKPVSNQVIEVDGAEQIASNQFVLEQGKCYTVYGGSSESGYRLDKEEGYIDYFYFEPKLITDFSKILKHEKSNFYDTTFTDIPHRLKSKLGTIDYDTIIDFIPRDEYSVKTITYRTISFNDGFGMTSSKFYLAKDISDSTVYFSGLIPDTNDSYVLKDEKPIEDDLIRSVGTTLSEICVPDSIISEDMIIRDTVWLSRRFKGLPKSRLDITLVDVCEPDKPVHQPVIQVYSDSKLVANENSSKLIVELEPNSVYKISGGSNMQSVDCFSYPDVILHGYQAFDGQCQIRRENYYIKGAEVSSKFDPLDTSSMLRDTVIYDTIFIKSHYSIKPPCEIAFTTLKGINKNVPYFQTAFWEVNTSENLGDYDISGSHLYYLGGAGYETDNRLATSSKFIELHPKGQYFPKWKGSDTRERLQRIKDYKLYAKEVDKNLEHISQVIASERIPQFMRLQKLSPTANHKLIIELEAVSDRRPVKQGVYTGTEVVNYTQAEFDEANGMINSEIVTIHPNAQLGADNDTLSKLRAWFGYKELVKKLNNFEGFASLLGSTKVLTPENILNAEDYRARIETADIIITAKGNFADSKSKASLSSYDRDNRDESFYLYDSTRKVNITVRVMIYENEKLIEPSCCSPDYKTSNLLSVEDYEKLYLKEEEIR